MANSKTSISVSELKDCLVALEKLKLIQKELKGKLNGALNEDEEVKRAEELTQVSKNIEKLEKRKCAELKISGV